MSDRYSVATRVDGSETWHVVVDGPVVRGSIDARQVVMEFRDLAKAEKHAAMLNGKRPQHTTSTAPSPGVHRSA
jgi:hypothetical protein